MNAEKRIAYRWYPKGSLVINHPDGLGVCYVSPFTGLRWQVVAYAGNAGKPSFNYSIQTRELAEKKVEEFFIGLLEHKVRVAERRANDNAGHSFQIGDVITNSWGYDQTNVDCYQITRTSKTFVWLKPIQSSLVPDAGVGPMSGRVVPCPGEFVEKGKETMHKARGEWVNFKYGSGSKWDGKRSLYCSWYA